MLESHIIQARALAASKEMQTYESMRENIGDVCDHQSLLTGYIQSIFYMN